MSHTIHQAMTRERAEQLLEISLAIPSFSRNEARLAHTLARQLRKDGFTTYVDQVGNLRATIGKVDAETDVVLLGHIDTVPGNVSIRRFQCADPRGAEWSERISGRGSVDAKGPFISFLAAASRLAANPSNAARFEIIGCVEEEIASSRGARHVLERPAPDYCVVGEPSGWNGITLGYKGCVSAELEYHCTSHHGAHPDEGSCERAVRAWTRIQEAACQWSDGKLYDQLLVRLDRMTSHTDKEGFSRAKIQVTLRLPEDLPPQAALDWLRTQSRSDQMHSYPGAPAWSGPRHSTLAREFSRAILQQGGRPRMLKKTGTADLNLVAPHWNCPAIAYGPGDSALDHTPDEYLILHEFHLANEVLTQALGSICAIKAVV